MIIVTEWHPTRHEFRDHFGSDFRIGLDDGS